MALYVAAEKGHTNIVSALLNKDSLVLIKQLYIAAFHGHTNIVSALLNKDSIDINKATTDIGATPGSCRKRSYRYCKCIIK